MRSKYINEENREKIYDFLGKDGLPLLISEETGLRVGDVVSMRYSQVYKHSGKFYIRFIAEKTGKKGTAEISEKLYRQIYSRDHSSPDAFIFPSKSASGHITRQTVWNRLKKAADRKEIDKHGISPHSYRKIFAVKRMHENGINAVQKALQHKSKAVTRVYAYADTIMNPDSQAPIKWCDLEMIVDYILDRLKERSRTNKTGITY